MRRLAVFNQVSLDGYFSGIDGDISWLNKGARDAEWDAFVAGNAQGDSLLLFGRVTYELMASYWPTPHAAESFPVVAERMNSLPKVVFSRTLDKTSWNNTRLVKSDPAAEVRKMKRQSGPAMTILGSGSIVAQLAQEGLIDEYDIVVFPVVLGAGKTMFDGVRERLTLQLTKTRPFGNGNVLLCYENVAEHSFGSAERAYGRTGARAPGTT
jgi:dihydrofolate reductase